MILLALNCGSSTIKYKLFEAVRGRLQQLAAETIEAQGGYRAAVERILTALPERPEVIAHRVVHGGRRFVHPTPINTDVEHELGALAALAPLHHPPALEGIAAARTLGVQMIAVFDTAFHRTLPEAASRYALPAELSMEIKRYGFHGLSHQSVTEQYAALASSPEPTIVTLHLGQGCSAAAVRKGVSVDTSMGFSPLEGLVMGTRAGDLDPGIIIHLLRRGWSVDDLERLLHHAAGLAGLCGTSDMRVVLGRSDPAARLAVEVFCQRIRKYVGAYLAVCGGAEAIVFTGGIGENAPEIRRRALEDMGWLGIAIDEQRNRQGAGRITSDESRIQAWVIRTDEEGLMAQQTLEYLEAEKRRRD